MIITITGPRSVGKSTISKIVAEKLKLKYISSDEIGEKALEKHGGLDKAIKSGVIKEFIKEKGYSLINDVYAKEDNFVFDLSGGSISSRTFAESSEELRKNARAKSIVIGLLPSENIEESVKFLFEREKERKHFKESDKTELSKKVDEDLGKFPPIFKGWCNFVVYTKDKTSEQIADEIVKKIKRL